MTKHLFKKESISVTYEDDFYYDFGLEAFELSAIITTLELKGTNWSLEDFEVSELKHYDEAGSSEYIGILQLHTKGRSSQDLLDLEQLWDAAEYICLR